MPRREEHWECRAQTGDRGWVTLYVRHPERRTWVKVGRTCPACGKIEDVREGVREAFSR